MGLKLELWADEGLPRTRTANHFLSDFSLGHDISLLTAQANSGVGKGRQENRFFVGEEQHVTSHQRQGQIRGNAWYICLTPWGRSGGN